MLGAGFGGLEIASILSERMGDSLDLILIDKKDSFCFGFSKLDIMFWRRPASSVRCSYKQIHMPGVRFRQESITSIDPETRCVNTDGGAYTSDILVIALGADYDISATPGLAEAGNEFYTVEGAERVRELLPGFEKGNVIVGVTSFPIKCPPAPSEAALLLHEYLVGQGVRKDCTISLVVPFEFPIPPSYGTSKALLKSFGEKNIRYIPEMMVGSLDPGLKLAVLDDGTEIPFDLFLGIPEHCVPKVLKQSGLIFDEWIPVDKKSFKTRFPQVYAIGDVTSVGTPKAGLFAVGAARAAAESIIAEFYDKDHPGTYDGAGSCYIEFGEGRVGRADVDFFSDRSPTGIHKGVSKALAVEKQSIEEAHLTRWFGKAE